MASNSGASSLSSSYHMGPDQEDANPSIIYYRKDTLAPPGLNFPKRPSLQNLHSAINLAFESDDQKGTKGESVIIYPAELSTISSQVSFRLTFRI